MDLSSMQGILVVIGPIVLAAALLWALLHNRGSRADVERTEAATRRMYDEQSREDEARERS